MSELLEIIQLTELTPLKIDENLGDAVEHFIDLKSVSLRPKSVKTYTESLNQLIIYFGSDCSVESITSADLASWLRSIDRSPSGVYMCWQTAGFFFRWFFAAEPYKNPMLPIHMSRPKRDPIKGIDPDQVRRILKKLDTPTVARDRAIIAVLFASGLRRQEFCGLQLQDVNPRTGSINVRSDTAKGGKFRQVYITGDALRLLNRWIKKAADQDPAAGLWQTRSGSPMTAAGVQEVLEKACKAAGVETYSFHDFRRGCALAMKRSGADIKAISHFLGHADIKTTERYLALDDTDALDTAIRFDPLKN